MSGAQADDQTIGEEAWQVVHDDSTCDSDEELQEGSEEEEEDDVGRNWEEARRSA